MTFETCLPFYPTTAALHSSSQNEISQITYITQCSPFPIFPISMCSILEKMFHGILNFCDWLSPLHCCHYTIQTVVNSRFIWRFICITLYMFFQHFTEHVSNVLQHAMTYEELKSNIYEKKPNNILLIS